MNDRLPSTLQGDALLRATAGGPVLNYREIAVAMTGDDASTTSIKQDQEPPGNAAARFDACPTWLEFASRHLSDAQAARFARISAGNNPGELARSGALEWEFEAALQAIAACGTAVDAFCAAVQSKIQLPQSLCDEWRENRTPRNIQVSEVFRRAFSLSADDAVGVRQCVGEILRFRDLAIDPSQKGDALVIHPELGTGVEWRFAYFRFENAVSIVRATLWLIWKLVGSGKPNDADVQAYVDALRPRVEPLRSSSALRAQAGSR